MYGYEIDGIKPRGNGLKITGKEMDD